MSEDTPRRSGRPSRNWRRKWKRVPAARRREAAAALGDVFLRRKQRGGAILLVLLLCGAGLHAALLPYFETGQAKDILHLVGKDSYIRKVVQTERAKQVSKGLARRITMPPPPPVPEAVVNTTLAEELTTDIQRVIGDTLDVKVTSKLTGEVTASLREELAAAAKSITDGKLTAQQIKALQDRFKRKAHRRTVAALRRHREETQVRRAQLSVEQWYEQRVSRTLRHRIKFQLYYAWGHFYAGAWSFLHGKTQARKVKSLAGLLSGRHGYGQLGGRPLGRGWRLLPDWPKPSLQQAQALRKVLEYIHGQSHYAPTWDSSLLGYIDSYYPHRREEIIEKHAKKMAAAWKQLFDRVQAYQARAEGGATDAELAGAQKDCLAHIKALGQRAAKVLLSGEQGVRSQTINRTVRSRVLRGPGREAAYKLYVRLMLDGLAPAVRDMAENEFQEGIIIRRKGVDNVGKQFAEKILTLLRRDIEETFSKRMFDDRVFDCRGNPYKSRLTGKSSPPGKEDIARDESALKSVLAGWPKEGQAYAAARTKLLEERFGEAAARVAKALLDRLLDEGRMRRDFYASVESVDYTDKVALRLQARARALGGRGQDLAQLTDEGVPDASASMVALLIGASKGHGASLQPVLAGMIPGYVNDSRVEAALRAGPPQLPPAPYPWARVTQPEVRPPFQSLACDGIPFLANFPRLDGDLTDWGKIRPLLLRKVYPHWPGPDEPILLYAAWNYQGFFFGYHVAEPAHRFAYPGMWRGYKETTGVVPRRAPSSGWAYSGDHFRMLFDTLDARGEWRGERHTQEFVILPRGTEKHPNIPGIERIIKSVRDAHPRGPWGGQAVDYTRIFLPQPSLAQGPDGTGPFRATRFAKDGYSVEVFLPRSLFNVRVFAPGWWIGFDCVVAMGRQTRRYLHGQVWGPLWRRRGHMRKERPDEWGDLLLLGTDPRLAVQDAGGAGSLSTGIVPGHSYLLTVIDPDRNIHLTARDAVVVSAEVIGGTGLEPVPTNVPTDDVEVYILKETGKNTSVFRGYVNTQPGGGRKVQGVLELMPGRQVQFGYVDLANAEGRRSVIYRLNLPVVAGLTTLLAAGP